MKVRLGAGALAHTARKHSPVHRARGFFLGVVERRLVVGVRAGGLQVPTPRPLAWRGAGLPAHVGVLAPAATACAGGGRARKACAGGGWVSKACAGGGRVRKGGAKGATDKAHRAGPPRLHAHCPFHWRCVLLRDSQSSRSSVEGSGEAPAQAKACASRHLGGNGRRGGPVPLRSAHVCAVVGLGLTSCPWACWTSSHGPAPCGPDG